VAGRDIGVGAGVAILVVAASARIEPNAGERALDAFAYLLMGVAALALVWRRQALAATGVVGAALVAYLLRDYAGDAILLAGPVALFGATYAVAAIFVLAVVGVSVLVDGGPGVVDLMFVGWSVAAVLGAQLLRAQGERRAEAERRALMEERLRIARELHDSVGHAMAAINVHSGVAARHLRVGPAHDALEAIRSTSAEVLDELATVLDVLRADGLDQLDALVESTRRHGLDVTVSIVGPTERVPLPVGAAAYRIIQEALTNVLRHTDGASVHLIVAADDHGGLDVRVDDDGPGRNGAAPGHGLAGMQERVDATGGHLETGESPTGGFRVRAHWAGPA
jgi:signal transduction histidine kinase